MSKTILQFVTVRKKSTDTLRLPIPTSLSTSVSNNSSISSDKKLPSTFPRKGSRAVSTSHSSIKLYDHTRPRVNSKDDIFLPELLKQRNQVSNRSTPVTLITNSLDSKSPPLLSTKLSSATSSSPSVLCCDKCDGKHETNNCPYFPKARDVHPDAQKSFYKKMGGTSLLPGALVRSARVVRQPGDGSCLFHSMSYGLKDGSSANSLRAEICSFVQSNPNFKISDTPLSDWIKWDSNQSCLDYSRKMSRGSWGGGIEMAVTGHIKGVNVHVYETTSSGYKRISAFDHHDSPEKRPTICVLYCGGVHYGKC
jgi:hypothetical protein